MSELLTAAKLSSVLEEQIAHIAPEWLAENPDLRERLAEVLADNPDQLMMQSISYEEFLAWLKDDLRAEWVEGKVMLMSPTSSRHQAIVVFLITLLNFYVVTRNLGVIFTAPYQMRLYQPPRGREPDILFVAQANLERIRKQYLDGPADLVIEVISPESISRDRDEKYSEYEMAGVREYWLIDPQLEEVEFYQLNEQGRYTLIVSGHSGRYTSLVIPGLMLESMWLWQEPLPLALATAQNQS